MSTINRDQLLDSARDYADRSIQAYLKTDAKAALTEAAVSLEHLSKAVLCAINPALLADLKNGSLDSMLHLIGEGGRAKPGSAVFTISGAEAIDRITKVLPNVTVPQDQIKRLIRLRNGVLHVGTFEEKESHLLLAAYLRLGTRLFEELGVAEADTWGEHQDVVDSVISETLNEIQKDVRRRMAKAKRTYDELMAKIPEEQREDLLNGLQLAALTTFTRSMPEGWDWDHYPCPVCSHGRGSLLGPTDVAFPANAPSSIYSVVLLFPESFVCGVCDLRLRDQDELETVGFSHVLQLRENRPDSDDGFIDNGPWTVD